MVRGMRTHTLAALLALTTACRTPDVPDGSVKPPHEPAAPGLRFEPESGRLSAKVRPVAYALDLTVDPAKPGFTGRATIRVALDAATKAFALHARDLADLVAIVEADPSNAVTLTKKEHDVVVVELARALPPGEHALRFDYAATFNADLAGLYRVTSGGTPYAFTQFEPLDARRAFPCFDEPGFKARFDVKVRTPSANTVIANTRELTNVVDGADRVVTFATTELLPTYLVALAVGPFDVVAGQIPATALRKEPLPFRGVAVKGKGPQLAFAMQVSGPILAELEAYFGLPYPFDKLDILAVPDFGAGAMENAGAVTFREQLLLLDPNSASESQRRAIVDVAAHEYAHQWFGNLVTMAWWDDLWLNEAFATWLGEKIVRKLNPSWETDLEFQSWIQSAMDADSLVSARVIRQPIRGDGDVESAFDALTYSKGGGLIAMYERYVGEEALRDGIRGYMRAHRFANATTDQFLDAALASQEPIVAASFKAFLDRPGVPSVAATPTCQDGKLTKIDVALSRYLPLGSSGDAKQPWQLPLCVRSSTGRHCGMLDTEKGALAISPKGDAPACPTFLLPNDGGEFYVRATPSGPDVTALLAALPSLAPRERLSVVDAVRAGFRKGTLPVKEAEAALFALAKDPVDAVRFGGLDIMTTLRDRVVPAAQRGDFEKRVRTAFSPAWAAVGWQASEKKGKPEEKDSLTRAQAFFALTTLGRDPALRKQATDRAKKLLADPKLTISGFDPELLEGVLTVGVVDGALFDQAVAALGKTDDALVRRALLLALGAVPGKDAAEKRLTLLLSGSLRQNETFRFAGAWFANHDTVADSWAVLSTRLRDVAERFPEGARDRLPMLADRLCDAGREAEIKAVFDPVVATIDGGPLSLANALERNRICAAVVRHHTGAKP